MEIRKRAAPILNRADCDLGRNTYISITCCTSHPAFCLTIPKDTERPAALPQVIKLLFEIFLLFYKQLTHTCVLPPATHSSYTLCLDPIMSSLQLFTCLWMRLQ